jgi:hypothetical protein
VNEPVTDTRAPSPPWFGALLLGILTLWAGVLLTYTLLDLAWQQALGAWNYVAAVVLILVAAVMLRLWHGDARR